MTTIAFDGKTIATDSRAIIGGYLKPQSAQKIRRIGDTVYAATGTYPLFEPMIEWHQLGADPKNVPTANNDDYLTLIVCKDGKCTKYSNECPYPDEAFAPDAWGSGAYYAIGAMKFGATAEQAVKVSMECDVNTGGDIVVEVL